MKRLILKLPGEQLREVVLPTAKFATAEALYAALRDGQVHAEEFLPVLAVGYPDRGLLAQVRYFVEVWLADAPA